MLRTVRRILGGALALAAAAAATVYGVSEWKLRRRHQVPPSSFTALSRTDVAEGRRRAIIVGCVGGCHGPEGVGGEEDAAPIYRVAAPTLPAVLPEYSDGEFARLVRLGVKRDGRSAVGMPAGTFYPISDHDLSLILGYLRQLPAAPAQPRFREVSILGRLTLSLGLWQVSADQVDLARPRWGELPQLTASDRGRYTAAIVCSECHGLDLEGNRFMNAPALAAVVRGYTLEQFRHLLRTGEPIGGRTLGLMGTVAARDFVHFTDQEIEDLFAYLSTH